MFIPLFHSTAVNRLSLASVRYEIIGRRPQRDADRLFAGIENPELPVCGNP
jgi:hypothetical protein